MSQDPRPRIALDNEDIDDHDDHTSPRGRLPPLQSEQGHGDVSSGGNPKKANEETIISVPEGGGFAPHETEKGILSMPGEDKPAQKGKSKTGWRPKPSAAAKYAPGSQAYNTVNQDKSVDMVVYFHDKTGVHLVVEDGQHMEAGELFEMVMSEMKFPPEAREAFSLWLVSDLLELQLKPNHIPFKLACYWEELLEKYTTVEEEDRERDEPVIMFMRNVFYPRTMEKKLTHPELLKLLYHEAKENIIDGRYPVEAEQYDMLAGLQALLQHRNFNDARHTPEYYRDKLANYYPFNHAKTKRKFPGVRSKDSAEFRIVQWHSNAFQKFRKIEDQDQFVKVAKTYLEFCWKLPFYGAAFFKGQIEHPGGNKFHIRSLVDDPVWIAINVDGVFVLDMDDVLFLIGLTFNQLSWEYAEPRDKDNPDCLSCLFLQFDATEGGQPVTKLLQVFSKEAVLMDAMIEACIKLKEQESKNKNLDDKEDEDKAMMKATGETWREFNRLCLATFSRRGDLLNNNARVPKKNNKPARK